MPSIKCYGKVRAEEVILKAESVVIREVFFVCYDLDMCSSYPDIVFDNVMPVMWKICVIGILCDFPGYRCVAMMVFVVLWQVDRHNYRENSTEISRKFRS